MNEIADDKKYIKIIPFGEPSGQRRADLHMFLLGSRDQPQLRADDPPCCAQYSAR